MKNLSRNPLENYTEKVDITIDKPDLISYQDTDMVWKAIINENQEINLKINQKYYNEMQELVVNDKTTKKYIKNQYHDARNFIKAIEERRKHTWHIANEIVKYQQEFFNYGETKIKPLVMKDIAELCSVNESTVSRIVNKRYITTPFGLRELKFFFNAKVKSISGDKSKSAKSNMTTVF